MASIMPIEFAGSTVRIFTIRFTGTAGITTHFITIRFIIPHGIHPTTVGDGVTAGIHPIIAWDGAIRPITATGTVHTILLMAGAILITPGTDQEEDGMPIQIITVTDREGQPEQMYCAATTVAAEHPHLQFVHQQQPPEVPARVLPIKHWKMAGVQLPVQV